MSRLIDTDKLIHALANDFISGKKTLGQVIDEQPTAFDVDKVIEQMEQRIANFDCRLCKYNFDDEEKPICREDCSDVLIDSLLEIVKGGGVE